MDYGPFRFPKAQTPKAPAVSARRPLEQLDDNDPHGWATAFAKVRDPATKGGLFVFPPTRVQGQSMVHGTAKIS
jgi:hypothetical protein